MVVGLMLQHTETALLGSIQEHSMRCTGAWFSMTLAICLLLTIISATMDFDLDTQHQPFDKKNSIQAGYEALYDALTARYRKQGST